MEPSSFGDRFGYLLWLRHLMGGTPASYEEIGKAVGRSGVAVGAWRVREDPPPDYRVHAPLADFFESSRSWVIDGEGDPPEPELWKIWARYRRAQPKPVPPGAMREVTRSDIAAGRGAAKKKRRAR